MKYTIVFLCFFQFYCFSQKELTVKNSYYDLDFLPTEVLLSEYRIILVDDFYALISKGEERINFIFFTKTGVIGETHLKIPKGMTTYLNYVQWLSNELIISYGDFKKRKIHFNIYSYNKKKFDLISTFENETLSFPFFQKGNMIWCSEIYPRKSKLESTHIQSFNLKSQEQNTYLVNHSLPIVGLLGNINNVDFNDSCYVVSQFEKYQVDFYNYNHVKYDSLIYYGSEFSQMDSSVFEELKKQGDDYKRANNYITSFMEGLNKYSGIWQVNILGENLLHIQLSNPKDNKSGFEIFNHFWVKENNTWNLKASFVSKRIYNNFTQIQTGVVMPFTESGTTTLFGENKIHCFLTGDNEFRYESNPMISDYFSQKVSKSNLILRLMLIDLK
jgi:hypothetical protein